MLLLLLFACVPGDSECVTEVSEITDDDAPLGELGFTVADVLADIGGERTLAGSLADGAAATGLLDILRGDGPAVLRDRGWVEGPRKLGIGHDQSLVYYDCSDSVEIPVDYDFATDDDAVVLASSATAAWSERGNKQGERVVQVVDEGPPGDAGTWMAFAGAELTTASFVTDDGSFTFPAEASR